MRWADILTIDSQGFIDPSEALTIAQNKPFQRRLVALTFGSLYAGDAAEQEIQAIE